MITFGKDKLGNMVHISDVASGKNCGVFCIISGEPLIARKGDINSHHFSYPANFNLSHYEETLTHHFAKEYFLENKTISIPYLLYQDNFIKSHTGLAIIEKMIEELREIPGVTMLEKIDSTHSFELKNIETEKRIELGSEYIVADIYGEIHTEGIIIPLIIEIYVTHACDEKKIEKLKDSKYFLLEIPCIIHNNLNSKEEIKEFLEENFKRPRGKFLAIPNNITEIIKIHDSELIEIKRKRHNLNSLEIQRMFKEREKKVINIPGFISESSPIPQICPIRQKIYKQTFWKNKNIIEKSPGIKKIFSNELFWDFSIIGNNVMNASIIVENHKKKFIDMGTDGGKKFLIFKQMIQDFIRAQNRGKLGKRFYRNGIDIYQIKSCKACKYYRGYTNEDGEIIDQCRYDAES